MKTTFKKQIFKESLEFYKTHVRKVIYTGIILFLLYQVCFVNNFYPSYYHGHLEYLLKQEVEAISKGFYYKTVSSGKIVVFAQYDVNPEEIDANMLHTLSKGEVLSCGSFKPRVRKIIDSLAQSENVSGFTTDSEKYYECVILDSTKGRLYYIYFDNPI